VCAIVRVCVQDRRLKDLASLLNAYVLLVQKKKQKHDLRQNFLLRYPEIVRIGRSSLATAFSSCCCTLSLSLIVRRGCCGVRHSSGLDVCVRVRVQLPKTFHSFLKLLDDYQLMSATMPPTSAMPAFPKGVIPRGESLCVHVRAVPCVRTLPVQAVS
jgi:hypothetical protein